MSKSPNRRATKALGWRLVCSLIVVLASLTPSFFAIPAQADAEDPLVRVELQTVSPTVLRIDGKLTITGTLTNLSTQPLSGLSVHLWWWRNAITNLDALNLALSSQPHDYYGTVLNLDPNSVALPTEEKPLQPGETRSFTISANNVSGIDPLQLTSSKVGYLVGAQVRQATGSRINTIGSARTLIGSLVPDQKVKTSGAVVLSARPSLLESSASKPSLFIDDHLASELSGRLNRLLALAEVNGLTPVIDPLLVDEVIAMAQGYQVSGTPEKPGLFSEKAKSWLTRLRKVINSGNAYRSLYGSPDVASAYASARPEAITDAIAALPDNHELARLPLAVIPSPKTTSPELLNFLAPAKPTLVLADTIDVNHTVQISDSQILVATPRDLYTGGPAPIPASSIAQKIGRITAHQIISSAQDQVCVLVVRTEDEAELVSTSADWRQMIPLADTISTSTPVNAQFSEVRPAPPAASEFLDAMNQTRSNLRLWGDLTVQDENALTLESSVLSAAWSSQFANPNAAIAYVREATRDSREVLEAGEVAIHTTQRWVLTSDVNSLPITVSNTLSIPVTVRVCFKSQNAARIDIKDTDLFTIPPGDSATVRVQPQAHGTGSTEITAQVVSAQGAPLSRQTEITVSANSAGRIGWLIVIGSGVTLLVATFLRVRQVRRTKAASHPIQIASPDYSGQPGEPIDYENQLNSLPDEPPSNDGRTRG